MGADVTPLSASVNVPPVWPTTVSVWTSSTLMPERIAVSITLHVALAAALRTYPATQRYVAVTGLEDLYVYGTLEYSTYPFGGAARPLHSAATHIGCVASTSPDAIRPHPYISHTSAGGPTRIYPLAHMYVATEWCALELLRTTDRCGDAGVAATPLVQLHAGSVIVATAECVSAAYAPYWSNPTQTLLPVDAATAASIVIVQPPAVGPVVCASWHVPPAMASETPIFVAHAVVGSTILIHSLSVAAVRRALVANVNAVAVPTATVEGVFNEVTLAVEAAVTTASPEAKEIVAAPVVETIVHADVAPAASFSAKPGVAKSELEHTIVCAADTATPSQRTGPVSSAAIATSSVSYFTLLTRNVVPGVVVAEATLGLGVPPERLTPVAVACATSPLTVEPENVI